jgi:hypothetical protein
MFLLNSLASLSNFLFILHKKNVITEIIFIVSNISICQINLSFITLPFLFNNHGFIAFCLPSKTSHYGMTFCHDKSFATFVILVPLCHFNLFFFILTYSLPSQLLKFSFHNIIHFYYVYHLHTINDL